VLARVARVLTWPFVRFDIAGAEQLNQELGACIIVTDHRSMFDIVAGLIVLHRYERYPRVLIEKKYVDSAWTRPFARAIGAIPVDRSAGRGEAFRAAVDALGAGVTILILPEGRLHWDPDHPLSTGPASTGISRLALQSGAPVLPAGQIGTEAIWPATARLPHLISFRRRVVTVRVADEVCALDPDADHETRTEQVMAEVRRLMAVAQASTSS